MMKRIIITLLSCMTFLVAMAQETKWDAMSEFMERLSARGAKVVVARVNDKVQIGKRYNVVFDAETLKQQEASSDSSQRIPLLVDSICLFLDQMSRRCVESYRYESHHNNSDTITYSIALRGYGKKNDYVLDLQKANDMANSWTNDYDLFLDRRKILYMNRYFMQERKFLEMLSGNNRNMYFGAREAVLFDYVNGKGNMIYMSTKANEAKGTYYHFKPESFDSLLNVLTSNQGVKSFPVHYQHREGESTDKATTYYSTDYLCPEHKGRSESKGTLYVVDSSELSAAIYQQLLQKAIHHVDTELTQCCELEYSASHFVFDGVKDTNRLLVNHQALSSFVMADIGKDGRLSILRLEVEGDYWIPRNWKK